jgi:Secretion system C-terminal sorting domain
MIKKITSLLIFISMSTTYAQTTFDWDTTPVDNGDNVTETISGITTTFTGTSSASFVDGFGFGGSSGNVIASSFDGSETTTSVSFNFSEAVDVTSILALESTLSNIDFTFTPTGGSNSPVVASLVGGIATVTLNWTGVTSFVVSSPSATFMAFDNLIVTSSTLSTDNFAFDSIKIYPNPVTDFLNLKNIKNLKSSKIYNSLGQLVFESKENEIDLRNLNKGLYFVKISMSDDKSINKKIIKN